MRIIKVWTATFSVSTENQSQIYVPTNDITQQISYDNKFLITTNNYKPISYSISKREDTSPVGVTMLTLTLEKADRTTDRLIKDRDDHKFNGGYWVADYDSYSIPPIDAETGEVVIPLPTPKFDDNDKSTLLLKCDIKGNRSRITVNSSYVSFTPQFYNENGELIEGVAPRWSNSIEGTDREQFYKFNVTTEGKYQIKCTDNTQIGTTFTIALQDEEGLYEPYTKEIEVR